MRINIGEPSSHWKGTHRGIQWQIIKSTRGAPPEDCWCYYLMFPLEQFPEDKRHLIDLKPEPHDDRYSHRGPIYPYMQGFLANLEWHCGITFYDKVSGMDGAPVVIKAGCDYQHHWDQGQRFSVESISYDVGGCIDALLEQCPWILHRCRWNGKFYPLAEGEYLGDDGKGGFRSFEGKAASDKWDAERAKERA